MCVCTDEAVVHSEERHLTGLVEQVGKSYEGVGCVQIQDEHSSDERHPLHLNTTQGASASKKQASVCTNEADT